MGQKCCDDGTARLASRRASGQFGPLAEVARSRAGISAFSPCPLKSHFGYPDTKHPPHITTMFAAGATLVSPGAKPPPGPAYYFFYFHSFNSYPARKRNQTPECGKESGKTSGSRVSMKYTSLLWSLERAALPTRRASRPKAKRATSIYTLMCTTKNPKRTPLCFHKERLCTVVFIIEQISNAAVVITRRAHTRPHVMRRGRRRDAAASRTDARPRPATTP